LPAEFLKVEIDEINLKELSYGKIALVNKGLNEVLNLSNPFNQCLVVTTWLFY